ncbi:MAG: GtrA family protein [Verrucomicrobiaceae bacterium]
MTAINEALDFFRNNNWEHMLGLIHAHEVPALVQFLVYAICGGLATAVYVGVSLALSHTLIPAMDGMSVNGVPLTHGHRARNALINNCIAFLIANAVGYITNVMFVFKSGRHTPVMEFLLFTVGNCVAFLISQFAGPYLIKRFGMKTIHALMTNVVASMLLNFVIRKYIVFKG